MKKNEGLSIIVLILISIMILVGVGFAANWAWNKISEVREADTEYNKEEVVSNLNMLIKEKYFFEYKYASENHVDFSELYTTEKVIQSLIDNGHIEQLKDINDNLVADQYYIHPETLKSDFSENEINENGSDSNGTKLFKLKKIDERFMIYFVDKYGEEEELGELIIFPEIK
jgi:hypothetical protein